MKQVLICIGIAIVILLSIDIWKRRDIPVPKFDETPYRDSIMTLEWANYRLDSANQSLQIKNNNLELTKQQVKIIYYEKVKYISGLSLDQLDSVILSNIQ